jgi:hypothetical protein
MSNPTYSFDGLPVNIVSVVVIVAVVGMATFTCSFLGKFCALKFLSRRKRRKKKNIYSIGEVRTLLFLILCDVKNESSRSEWSMEPQKVHEEGLGIDHGKSDELGSGPNWKKIARFKRLENSRL